MTYTTIHVEIHYNNGSMGTPAPVPFFQTVLTWQVLILIYKNFMIFGPWDELINAPQYWMDYFYPTNFFDWLSYESQCLKLKTYSAKQVWIYFNKCIITSSRKATTTDRHKPLWREMGWKEKKFRQYSNIQVWESRKRRTHHGQQSCTIEYKYYHNRVHHSRTTMVRAIQENVSVGGVLSMAWVMSS